MGLDTECDGEAGWQVSRDAGVSAVSKVSTVTTTVDPVTDMSLEQARTCRRMWARYSPSTTKGVIFAAITKPMPTQLLWSFLLTKSPSLVYLSYSEWSL